MTVDSEIDLSQPGKSVVQETESQPKPASIAAQVVASAKEVEHKSATELQATAATDTTKSSVATTMPQLLDPSMVAYMNSLVRESITAALATVLPTIQKMNEPSPKEQLELDTIEKARERERREREQSKLQDADNRANLLAKQRSCGHRDANEKSSISTIHNLPSRQVAGICVQCQKLIQGKRYEVSPPSVALGSLENAKEYCALLERENGYARDSIEIYKDPRTGRFTHLLLPADADYHRVIDQERKQGMAVA